MSKLLYILQHSEISQMQPPKSLLQNQLHYFIYIYKLIIKRYNNLSGIIQWSPVANTGDRLEKSSIKKPTGCNY